MSEESGTLVRTKGGQFIKGESGNPAGRPKGSKNVITVQKLLVEEAFRGEQSDAMAEVLALIVQQALQGDSRSQKLIWDANVSRQAIADEKNAGAKQSIVVHTMNVDKGVTIEGEFDIEESADSQPITQEEDS